MSVDLKIRKLLVRCFNNGFNAIHTADLVIEKYGVKGYGSRTCQRWFRKFRSGDFNLLEKPTHDNKPRKRAERGAIKIERKSKLKLPQKELEVEEVTFKQETRPQAVRTPTASPGNDIVQKILQEKREITVSRVKQGTIRVKEPSKLMSKRISLPPNRGSPLPLAKPTPYRERKPIAPPVLGQRRPLSSNNVTSRSQSRLKSSLGTDLRLPPSIAKKLKSPHISTENHIIGAGSKGAQKIGETAKKPITVQFQNVSPEVAKNTVRKSTESGSAAANASKRLSAQSSSPLASPKGVIYLNPQEIFGESIGFKNPLKKATLPVPSAAKPPTSDAAKTAVKAKPPAPVVTPAPPAVTVDVSDSEDDLLFPEDVSIPPPKVKAVVNTFTTYWDMETDKPILLNPTKELVSTLPVIEID